ncbi:MAG TPA: hypothetical protein VK013_11845 [Myxococcaceae bacterium]|nr:hypothetical protein [Myxococcaceae bacterium]
MRTTALLTSALLCLCACGDSTPNPDGTPENREAGLGPGDKVLLWVESSSYTTDACSNQAEWTAGLEAFNSALSNAYVAFGGNDEGSVDLLRCAVAGDLESCTPRNPPVRYEVNGLEYSRSFEDVSPIEDVDCTLVMNFDVVLTDAGDTIVERATRTHSLTGSDCEAFEELVVSESPNGRGISGCAVTFTSQMAVRKW